MSRLGTDTRAGFYYVGAWRCFYACACTSAYQRKVRAMNRPPSECLRLAIDALGGDKRVGALLRPDIDPALAGQWVAHCLDDDRREKFSLSQVAYILTAAKAKGAHDGFTELAASLGYAVTAVLDPHEQAADLAKQAQAAAERATTLTTQALALMRAAGVKVDA